MKIHERNGNRREDNSAALTTIVLVMIFLCIIAVLWSLIVDPGNQTYMTTF